MTLLHYVLDEHGEPRPEPDLIRWARWFETAWRRVCLTEIPGGGQVSTVFLGLDHDFDLTGRPVLWETLVRAHGHPMDTEMERYTSRADAERGHAEMVARCLAVKGTDQ